MRPSKRLSLLAAGVLLAAGLVAARLSPPAPVHAAAAAGAGHPVYFAEGTTRPGFQEYIALENAGSQAATVNLTYEFADGSASQAQSVAVAANSRSTVDVNQAVGAGRDVSVVVDPGGNPNVFAERPVYFSACLPVCTSGSHVAAGAQPQATWYFAEGYTGLGFQEYITLFNPNSSPSLVGVNYSFADGSSGVWTVNLPATSRYTVNVNQFVSGTQEVAARIDSALPIVAERQMYFNGCISAFCMKGGDDAVGTGPQSSWYFAEGYTGPGYHEYLTVFNPAATAALVGVDYMYSGGGGGFWQTLVPAGSRQTIDVNLFVKGTKEVSALVTSSTPVVVERPLYYATLSPFWQKGGSVTAGFQAGPIWNFPEGYTGPGFQEYVTILNPGSTPAPVSLRYLAADGTSATQSVTVGAAARLTIDVNAVLQGGRQVSTQVASSVPIVVERPMYMTGCLGSICINIPPPPPRLHKIVVSLSKQHLWAYAGPDLFLETDVATGRPALPTPPGDYHIFLKQAPFQFVSMWPPGDPFWYPSAWVQYAMEFIGGGYFLHDAPWRSWYGPGANVGDGTHGCVNIPIGPMTRLYGWAQNGDEVVVQD